MKVGQVLLASGVVAVVVAVVLALTVGALPGAIALVVGVSDLVLGLLFNRGAIGKQV